MIVDGRYFQACKEKCAFEVQLAGPQTLKDQFIGKAIAKVGFDQEAESYASYTKLKALIGDKLVPLSKPILQMRAVKDEREIEKIKATCNLGSLGFDFTVSQLREGITEKMVAAELDIFWKKRGADGLAFSPIIAFGKNSALPHHRAGDTALVKNEIVLIDIGVQLDGYNSDMTRMVYFGSVDPKLEQICQVCLSAQSAALIACKAGIFTSELDQIARDVITAAGFGEYFVHGLGHGVGLDIHEEPIVKKDLQIKDTKLEAGMVVTIEPGIYLPGLGGCRIEDQVLINDGGCQNLTKRNAAPLKVTI